MAFFYANVRTAERGTHQPLIGIVGAVALGWLIYRARSGLTWARSSPGPACC